MSQTRPAKLKTVKDLGFQGIFFCMARVPESSRLFVGNSDFKVYEIDVSQEKPELVELTGEGHRSYVTGAALAGKRLITGSYDGRLIWWNSDKRQQVRAVDAHEKWIRGVETSPDGQTVASVADDMVARLWDAESGKLLHELRDHEPQTPHNYPSMLYACNFSPDGRLLATADKVGHVAVWNVADGKKVGEVEAPVMYTWDPKRRRHSIGGIRAATFSPDSQQLAVGGIGTIGNIDHLGGPPRIEIFDWDAGKRLHEISEEGKQGIVERIAFHDSGEWLVAAGGKHKGIVLLYDAKSGESLHVEEYRGHIHDMEFNESQDVLYTVGHDARIVAWQMQPEEGKQANASDASPSADGTANVSATS